ncbi:MAG: shikimate dehydrogenase [Bacillota bacterium]|nr:shikimate dehydrogenase [Bacillota bacterium]
MDSQTNLYGLIGHPILHSMSPEFQNKLIELFNINAAYLAFDVEKDQFDSIRNTIKTLNIKGLNVTVPYKETIIPYLDKIDESADRIGAVNTIEYIDGQLIGYNTDASGFIRMLKELDVNIDNHKVVVLGAGGAAKAIIYALEKLKIDDIIICNRTIEKADRLLEKFKFKNKKISSLQNFQIEDDMLIINTTSLGLNENESPVVVSKNVKNTMLIDIIYNPFETKLIKDAKVNGIYAVNGLPMLIYQGIESFKIWHRQIEKPFIYYDDLYDDLLRKLVV